MARAEPKSARIDLRPKASRRPGVRVRAAGALAALAILAAGAPAAAETSAEQAERLFREATALIAAKRYDAACEKLAESGKLDPAVGTFYNLGSCLEHEKRYASAKQAYDRAAQLAREQNNAQGAARAADKSARVAAKVARLTLVVARDVSAPSASIDGAAVAISDTPFELDPGSHRVKVTAAGRGTFEKTVDLGEADAVTVEARFDPVKAPGKDPVPPPSAAKASGSWSTLRFVGLGVAGVGALGLGAGGFFGLRASSELDNSGCRDGRFCPNQESATKLSDAKTSANLSTIFFVAGGALLVGGVVLFVLAPDEKAAAATAPVRRLGVAPAVGAGAGGVSVVADW
jgi:tetratricopeptide (TPR) repeat protein